MERMWSLAKQIHQSESQVFTAEAGANADDSERVTLESVRRALNQSTREMVEAKVAEKYKMCCNSTPLAGNQGLRA